jgi:hypothetical protein
MKRAVSTLASLSLATAASAQIQAQKLIASDTQAGDRFGRAVAISGDWAIVGAPQDDDIAEQSGAAYVYHRNGTGWIETQKLKASDPDFGDAFGWSVALSGATAVVAAPTDAPGVSGAGSVYVFDLVGGTWAQTAKFWASDAIPAAHFGDAVACRDDRIVVGAREDDGAGYQAGAAYVFDRVGTAWTESAKLVANDAAAFDFLGASVSVFGDVVLLGAPDADGPAGSQGAAYVFENVGGVWSQSAKLVASDAAHSDFFGIAVAIETDIAMVGAVGHDHLGSNAGAVYTFERQGGTWLEIDELHPTDAGSQDQFGSGVAIAGELALLAAIGDADLGFGAGAAYAFRRTTTSWTELGKLLPRDGAFADNVGLAAAVALSGTTALLGNAQDDDACPSSALCNSGSAYVFDLAPDAVQYGHCASAAPCANADPHGGCVNSTGRGAILAAGGSSSVASDELVLEARDLPPDKSAIVFMGGGQTQVPLGDGLRVVTTGGVGLRRFPMQTSDAEGWLTFGPGIAGLTQSVTSSTTITAGSVWNFQCWYRDPSGPCANATNLTNGVQVAFTP